MSTKRLARTRRIDARLWLIASGAILFALVLALALVSPSPAVAQTSGPRVDLIAFDTEVNFASIGYVERVLNAARTDGSQAVVLQINTPGGDVNATHDAVMAILNSPVPVISFVAPSGARAGSAGTFITIAAGVAAMAPGTNIGAAHPVDAGGGDITGTIGIKITDDAAALIRTAAEQSGHNADWAEQAVRQSVSITEKQALDLHVVDIVARDVGDLLNQADGRTVNANGQKVTLHVKNADVHPMGMTVFEEILILLFDPSVAAIFLQIGLLAIAVELYNPGATLPGIVGVICLIVAGVVLFNLPTNWAAVLLIVASVLMFVLDIKFNSFVLTLGGIVAFVLGAVFLFRPFTPPEPTAPELSVSPIVITVLAIFTTALFVLVLNAAVRSRHVPVTTGMAPYLGAVGIATSELNPEGTVRVKSEDWTAETDDGPIHKGERIKVVLIEGLRFRVVRAEPERPELEARGVKA